jgi:hypothetical protein
VSVISALRRLRQEDIKIKTSLSYIEFEGSLGYRVRLCLKIKTKHSV